MLVMLGDTLSSSCKGSCCFRLGHRERQLGVHESLYGVLGLEVYAGLLQ